MFPVRRRQYSWLQVHIGVINELAFSATQTIAAALWNNGQFLRQPDCLRSIRLTRFCDMISCSRWVSTDASKVDDTACFGGRLSCDRSDFETLLLSLLKDVSGARSGTGRYEKNVEFVRLTADLKRLISVGMPRRMPSSVFQVVWPKESAGLRIWKIAMGRTCSGCIQKPMNHKLSCHNISRLYRLTLAI